MIRKRQTSTHREHQPEWEKNTVPLEKKSPIGSTSCIGVGVFSSVPALERHRIGKTSAVHVENWKNSLIGSQARSRHKVRVWLRCGHFVKLPELAQNDLREAQTRTLGGLRRRTVGRNSTIILPEREKQERNFLREMEKRERICVPHPSGSPLLLGLAPTLSAPCGHPKEELPFSKKENTEAPATKQKKERKRKT